MIRAFPRKMRRHKSFALGFLTVVAALSSPAANADPSTADWPQLSRDPHHTSVAYDASMNPVVASQLGVRWMTNMYAADLGSPVVAYDPKLRTSIVYAGNQRGDLLAYNAQSGQPLWSTSLGYGTEVVTTPLVSDGAVWAGTNFGSTLYKVDASTGAVDCSLKMRAPFEASATVATVGGVRTIFTSTIDLFNYNGPMLAVNEASCSTIFAFTGYVTLTGVWASPAVAVDAMGRQLLVAGSADPDSVEYAVDAATGKRVWFFRVANPAPHAYDIGSGATIAPPNTHGFADGAVFFPSKLGIMYALDLTTGKELWEFNFNAAAGATEGGLSDPALIRNTLVFGYSGGVYAINATTGATIWQYKTPSGTEVVSAPAVVGTLGKEVVAFADLAGVFHVLRLADGASLYSYQTGGYITSSVAESNGQFYVASSDGYLYDFAQGGGNAATGVSTAITSPSNGASLAKSGRTVRITGTASSNTGVSAVRVAVQAGGPTGPYYNAATGSWTSGAVGNFVPVAQPGATSSTWHLDFPAPPVGGAFQAFANAIDTSNLSALKSASSSFVLRPASSVPHITASASYVAPAGSFLVKGAGFQPAESVALSLQGAVVAMGTADEKGNLLATTVTLPVVAPFGPATVAAAGVSSGATAQATIDITNAWSQAGFGSTHTYFEPNDHVLESLIHPGAGLFLARAWIYATGAPVRSSPAVVDGVAYVGNDAGTLTAVNVITGVPMWSVRTPTKAPIRSTPCVDSGIVSVTDNANKLFEFVAATGALVGTIDLGSRMTSAAVVNGTFYVGTAAGKIVALSESSGAMLWARPMAAAVEDTPSIDPATNELIAGDDNGNVIAFDATTGQEMWRYKTTLAIVASPAIFDGAVYVGSTDGTLYVLDETTGKKLWTFALGSPIETTPVLGPAPKFYQGNAVFVAGSKGTLVALNTSGDRVWTVPFGNPIVGVSASFNTIFVETSTGLVSATRGPGDGLDFWRYQTGSTLHSTVAVVDGAAYVGAADGGLYAFTPYARAPFARKAARALP